MLLSLAPLRSIATRGLDEQDLEEGFSSYQEGVPELNSGQNLFIGDVIIYGFLSLTAAAQ